MLFAARALGATEAGAEPLAGAWLPAVFALVEEGGRERRRSGRVRRRRGGHRGAADCAESALDNPMPFVRWPRQVDLRQQGVKQGAARNRRVAQAARRQRSEGAVDGGDHPVRIRREGEEGGCERAARGRAHVLTPPEEGVHFKGLVRVEIVAIPGGGLIVGQRVRRLRRAEDGGPIEGAPALGHVGRVSAQAGEGRVELRVAGGPSGVVAPTHEIGQHIHPRRVRQPARRIAEILRAEQMGDCGLERTEAGGVIGPTAEVKEPLD